MVYKILESDPVRNTHKFFVDDIEDLETLPKEPASTALVANTGDTYICNNNKQWIMYIDNPIGNTPNSSSDTDDGGSDGFVIQKSDYWVYRPIYYANADPVKGDILTNKEARIDALSISFEDAMNKNYFTRAAGSNHSLCPCPRTFATLLLNDGSNFLEKAFLLNIFENDDADEEIFEITELPTSYDKTTGTGTFTIEGMDDLDGSYPIGQNNIYFFYKVPFLLNNSNMRLAFRFHVDVY